jgi:hypothetical protein
MRNALRRVAGGVGGTLTESNLDDLITAADTNGDGKVDPGFGRLVALRDRSSTRFIPESPRCLVALLLNLKQRCGRTLGRPRRVHGALGELHPAQGRAADGPRGGRRARGCGWPPRAALFW